MSLERVQSRVDQLEPKVQGIELSIGQLISAVEKQTQSTNKLNETLIAYTTKHDMTAAQQKDFEERCMRKFEKIENDNVVQGKMLAEMKPITDATRGLVWKIFGSFIATGAGVAAVVTAITKAG